MAVKVWIDENGAYQDPEARYSGGEYPTYADALAECTRIVNADLREQVQPGIDADLLLMKWKMFGRDPWISGDSSDARFRARDYASERAGTIAMEAAEAAAD